MEDESGRVEIIFKLSKQEEYISGYLTSGMVLGLKGYHTTIQNKPFYLVESIYFASSFSPTVQRPVSLKEELASNEFVITSSLLSNCVANYSNVQQLFYFLQEENSPSHLILAGNICSIEQDHSESAALFSEFDSLSYEFLTNCQNSVDRSLIIIPGPNDPTSIALPQRSIPRGFFRKCATLSNDKFELPTNPTYLLLDKKSILIISGQNINDMVRYNHSNISHQDRQYLAHITLLSRHIAPTAPDTLCN